MYDFTFDKTNKYSDDFYSRSDQASEASFIYIGIIKLVCNTFFIKSYTQGRCTTIIFLDWFYIGFLSTTHHDNHNDTYNK